MGVREMPILGKIDSKTALILLLILGGLMISGCKAQATEKVVRIALLAPFEGRYRELGYNAYYAARLALQDFAGSTVELVPVDDGGTLKSATERATALQQDGLVKVVVALGKAATDEAVQRALGDLPMMVVGYWGNIASGSHVVVLANEQIPSQLGASDNMEIVIAAEAPAPLTGNDMLALAQLPLLRPDSSDVTVISSGSLPDNTFRERYVGSGQFVPEPGLLATLTYDAFGMVLEAIEAGNVAESLTQMTYEGLNGSIHFEHGYWVNAPMNRYCYEANPTSDKAKQNAILQLCN